MMTPSKKPAQGWSASGRYFEAVGRRKTSIARVRLFAERQSGTNIEVNGKPYNLYFNTAGERLIASAALRELRLESGYRVVAKIKGGGIHSQAGALRHGIARALLKIDPEHRKTLKPLGFLTRDPRAKERRKFGLKKARKAPQWAKR